MWLQVPPQPKNKEISVFSLDATSTTASGLINQPIRGHQDVLASLDRTSNRLTFPWDQRTDGKACRQMSNRSLLICLRLNCYYAPCLGAPPYDCEVFTSTGSLILKESNGKCWVIIPNHRLLYGNTTTSYNCTLTRRTRREEKSITIDYSIGIGKR